MMRGEPLAGVDASADLCGDGQGVAAGFIGDARRLRREEGRLIRVL
jgi:hypothetical protein